MDIKLSVIIPVYNEAPTVMEVLRAVQALPVNKEIIIVDGNSTDGTRELLEAFGSETPEARIIFQTKRNGRGGALQEGLEQATGDVVVFQDADLELDPNALPKLMQPIENGKCNVVFGSRFLDAKPQMTILQYIGNRVLNIVTNILWGTKLTDVETCYQMFRRDIISGMSFQRKDMAFTMELTLALIAAGHNIVEIPVEYHPRTGAEGKKLYWGDGFVTLWVIIQTWLKTICCCRRCRSAS
ncbi:glycosyltransferase family 2 protein [Candidatus Sumerlaeota bacterium]|nr:glycosyltransferase family 2 protein [Candidatus Sumerlaeales bacterium]NLD62242.1 glycosyltransferase family 2 protein [Candidatus Sumerlaeota bacterium]